jgi:hypothetical protein
VSLAVFQARGEGEIAISCYAGAIHVVMAGHWRVEATPFFERLRPALMT